MGLGTLTQGDEIGQIFGSDISFLCIFLSIGRFNGTNIFPRLFIPFDETSFLASAVAIRV